MTASDSKRPLLTNGESHMTVPHLYRVILPVSNIDLAAKFYGYVFQDDGQRVSPGVNGDTYKITI
ncbi:MAG: hypothetical protein O2971_03320 [Proteobacteria bacterium]|nr:hypothetical protein [Pseudomonadota bacterium]